MVVGNLNVVQISLHDLSGHITILEQANLIINCILPD